ncbi:MAG: hypothetical protein AB8B63_02920 [Granulosicoccus sp.]
MNDRINSCALPTVYDVATRQVPKSLEAFWLSSRKHFVNSALVDTE